MKGLPKFVIILIFIVYFCAGFVITAKLTNIFLAEKNIQSLETNSNPYFWVMTFTANDVQILRFDELEELKKKNSEYSFLVPKDKENYYNEKLANRYKNLSFHFEVEQISQNNQLIKLDSGGSELSGTITYEATDKEIILKPSLETVFITSFLGGVISCLIFPLVYMTYLSN